MEMQMSGDLRIMAIMLMFFVVSFLHAGATAAQEAIYHEH